MHLPERPTRAIRTIPSAVKWRAAHARRAFVAFFIDRPIFASVVAILITLAGVITIPLLPVSQFPPIAPPTVQVSASYTAPAPTWSSAPSRCRSRNRSTGPTACSTCRR